MRKPKLRHLSFFKKISFHKSAVKSGPKARDFKKSFRIGSSIFVILILIAFLIFGIAWSATDLKYTFNTGIAYSGGFQVVSNVYDYNKPLTPPANPDPNGDAKKDWPLLQDKLDPLKQKNLAFSTIGEHSVEVEAPKSLYTNATNFEDAVNREGALFLIDPKLKSDDAYDGDLLLKRTPGKTEGSDTFQRTPIKNVFTSVSATINRSSRKPIVQFSTGSDWSQKSKKTLSSKDPLYIWTDLGLVLNKLRTYDANFALFRNFMVDFQKAIDKITDPTGKSQANSVFQFKVNNSRYVPSGEGNMLDLISTGLNEQSLKGILNNISFQWERPISALSVNPNEGIPDKAKGPIKNVSKNEREFLIPFEATIQKIFTDYQSNVDFVKTISPFLLNWKDIKAKTALGTGSNSIYFYTDSESDATIMAALVKSGLSGINFRVISTVTVDPIISSGLLEATLIVLGIVFALGSGYLVLYYRSFGFLTVMSFAFSILMTIYVASLLSVTFSPVSFAALIIAFVTILSAIILIIRRYKLEKIKTKLPFLTALKIALKQTLPFLIDGTVIFVILTLSIYWFSAGQLKSFSITLLIGLLITFVAVIGITSLLFYLMVRLNLFDRFPFLDVQKKFWEFPRQIKLQKTRDKSAVKKAKVSRKDLKKIDNLDEPQMKRHSKNNPSSDGNQDLWSKNESNLVIEENVAKPSYATKIKEWFKHRITFFNLIKWTPLFASVMIIAGIVVFFTGAANFDSSVQKGAVYTYNQAQFQIYTNPETREERRFTPKEQKTYIEKVAKTGIASLGQIGKYDLASIQASINVSSTFIDGSFQPSLTISTDITTIGKANQFNDWLRSTGTSVGDIRYIYFNFRDPTQASSFIKATFIALGVGIGLIVLYIIFRFDWAQFLSIVSAGLFSLALTFGIVATFQILISTGTIVILAAIWCFAVVNAAFIMSKAREIKRKFDIKAYESFFADVHSQKEEMGNLNKIIHFKPNQLIKQHVAELKENDPGLNKWYARRQMFKQFKANMASVDLPDKPTKEAIKQAKIQKQTRQKEYIKYNHQNNFLYKIANMTMKEMFLHYFLIALLSTVILVVLSVLSGYAGSYFIAMLIGILVSIYAAFIVTIPIWVQLEKRRAINQVKLMKYLDSRRVSQDEEKVEGINS